MLKKQLRSYSKTLLYGILAGGCIGIGGAGFLSVDNRVMGAVMFSVGLFTILTFGFNLFTGKVCYVLERNRRYALGLPVIWLGNLIGAWLTAEALQFTRLGPLMTERAIALCQVKLDDSLLSIFILSFFCNILIYIAVDGFNNSTLELGKYLAVFYGVVVFIVEGFEHCVANMFYFSMADMWTGETWICVIVMSLGNAAGGVAMRLFCHWRKERPKRYGEKEK